jgi:4'-phosphopantetheinyl transferase
MKTMIISTEAVTLIHTDTHIAGIPETELFGALTDEEKEQADRFRFDNDRQNFVLRRGLLRQLLGKTLGIAPALIRFDSTPVGKPFIAYPENAGLSFNLSHSGRQIVFAFSRHPETGIDIERIRTVDDIDQLALKYFSAEEYAIIINLPSWEKNKAFIRIWSIKEALIKACGCPLEYGLAAFDVATQYRMNRFLVPFGHDRTITCVTPVFDYICGFATALAIQLDNNEPLNLRRYSLQNGEYIEL